MRNWLDILLVALILFSAFAGWRRGLIRQVVAVAGFVASYAVALRYGNEFVLWLNRLIPVAAWFPQWFTASTLIGISLGDIIVRLLGFMILFMLVGKLFDLLGLVLHGIFSLPVLGWINGAGGMLLGLLKGMLLILVLVAVARLVGMPAVEKVLSESLLASAIANALPVMYEQMKTLLLADIV